MKRNTSLLADQVRNKLTGKCTTGIITEAFINALPFDKDELANEAANLSRYAVNVIDKMHPETLLDRALESTLGNQKANLYVSNLKSAIDDVVTTATKRIVQESLVSDNPTPEIVAQTKLNSDETEKLVAASKKSGTDEVAKLVKEKMINVIKDEKTAYETSAKLREEVKDVIRQEREDLKAELTNDEAIESYFSLVLEPTDAREHISVFSKMQDVCMEGILHSREEYDGEIPYSTLEKITLESTFPYFDLSNKTLMEDLENMMIVTESVSECSEEESEIKKKKIAKTAFICTICIMTLLETLKTMHIAKPSIADVKNFVDDNTSVKKLTNVTLANVEDKVNAVVNDTKKSVAMGAYNTLELEQAKESLEKVKGIIDSMIVAESDTECKSRILTKIDSGLDSINSSNKEENKTVTGHFITRLKEENLANLEHGIQILAKKPMVQEIKVSVRSDLKCSENSKVDIELKGVDASGSPVAVYMISIHALEEFGATVAEVIRDCANYCNLGNKPVKMYFTDSGYAVPLKG